MMLALILFSGLVIAGVALLASKFINNRFIKEVGSFFWVLLIVFVVRSFVIEPFRIPSGSMLPTLYLGDFIAVKKYGYGIRWPLNNKKIIATGDPERGDVVVFLYPEDTSVYYIKRLVGLPGDTIRLSGHEVYINGEKVAHQPDGQFVGDEAGAPGFVAQQLTEPLGDVSHSVLWGDYYDNATKSWEVPEGQYFVMGDNRDNSRDSRYWGFVPDENLVGKPILIWLSWFDGKIRWDRLFDAVN